MKYSYSTMAGVIFFLAAAQFILALFIAEALYPGYSISNNYISDLGVGPSSIIFNISVFLQGLLFIIATFFLHRAFQLKILTVLLALAAIGSMGVGIFTEEFATMHYIASVMVFLFGGLSTICSYRLTKSPLSFIIIFLGVMSLVALVLFSIREYLGLGAGGMERMIAYPILIWAVGFGGYLIVYSEKK